MADLLWHPVQRLIFGPTETRSASFDPAQDIPSLAGKVILITGGAGDLGRQLAIEYARHGGPERIYIADLPRENAGEALVQSIQEASASSVSIVFLEIDLASLSSVQQAAARFMALESRLGLCILNAGVVLMDPGTTDDGYEITFGISFLGHALLTKLLIPVLVSTAAYPGTDVRIIVVSSEGQALAPREGVLFERLKSSCDELSYTQRYGQSKVACIGYARELALRYPQIKTVAVHPGRIMTGLFRRLQKESALFKYTSPIRPFFCTSVENGVKNHLWASTAPAIDVASGTYYEPIGIPGRETKVAKDEHLAKRLWDWTACELKNYE